MLSHIWVKFESDLDQLSTKLLTSSNRYTVNSLVFTVNWLEFDLWYIHNMSHSQTLNEFYEASTSWDIKNVKQLQHWIKQDSEIFLEDLNSLRTQRNLDVKACELFDKISSEQIWKTRFEKMNKVKERLNQLNQTFWNQVTEL